METLYTARLHGFVNLSRSAMEPALTEENVLSLLIVLGSSISLVGLVFAFITYSLFSDMRNLSGTTLMNLLAALFITQLLYVIGVGDIPEEELCLALALVLQYLKLSTLCWMLVLTHHMHKHFKNFEKLLLSTETSMGKTFLKYSAFSWGIPCLFLGVPIAAHYKMKKVKVLHTTELEKHNCWFLDTDSYVYGFLLPSIVIVIFIFSYLIRSAIVARYIISMQVDNRIRHKMERKRNLQISLFSKLTFNIILVTALSTLYKLSSSKTLWIGYHVAQCLQGIFVTMLVICNCQVLRLYTKKISERRYPKLRGSIIEGKRDLLSGSSMAKSTSLQLLLRDPIPDPV